MILSMAKLADPAPDDAPDRRVVPGPARPPLRVSDMFVHPDDDPRTDGASRASRPVWLATCVTSA
jgi:hypothetical protein